MGRQKCGRNARRVEWATNQRVGLNRGKQRKQKKYEKILEGFTTSTQLPKHLTESIPIDGTIAVATWWTSVTGPLGRIRQCVVQVLVVFAFFGFAPLQIRTERLAWCLLLVPLRTE